MAEQMQLLDIIRDSVGRELGPGANYEEFLKKLATLLQDKNNTLVQMGNTVFLMKKVGPDTVELHTFSSETPKNLVQNFIGAAKFLKNQGMKRAVTYADSPGYLEIAKKTGLPVKIGQSTRVMGGVAKPVYTFELEL